jgi:LemA protein
LVETVKGYAKHESETLASVISLRGKNYDSMTEAEKIESGAAISRAIPNIMALAESYPDLKANQNFMDLSSQLTAVEEDIANSRKYYNGAVRKYNTSVQTVPCNIIAGMFHFEKKALYEVESAEERKNVQVKF